MNNVLGILILVLILTQVVGVSETGLTMAPEAELTAMQKHLQNLVAQTGMPLEKITPKDIQTQENRNAMARNQLKKDIAALAKMDTPIDANIQGELIGIARSVASAHAALDNVKSRAFLEEEAEKYKQQVSDAMDKRQADLSQLKDLQDDAAHGGQAVSIGHGRPAVVLVKPDAVITLVCRKGMLGLLDWEGLSKSLHEANQRWNADPNSPSGWDSFARYVNSGNWGDASFQIALQVIPDGSGIYMVPQPRYGDKWASASNLPDEKARLQKKLATLDPKKSLVRFLVYGDSFSNYVDLVQVTKNLGFKTSWVPFDNDEPIFTTVRPGHPNPNSTSGIPADPQ